MLAQLLTSHTSSSQTLCLRVQTIKLYGTVTSADVVNISITVPPAWAASLYRAEVFGQGMVDVRKPRSPFLHGTRESRCHTPRRQQEAMSL